MADMILVNVRLPDIPTPHDVTRRRLKVHVDDPKIEDVFMHCDADEVVIALELPEDSRATLTLRHLDAAENESEPTQLSFVVKDTIPPPAPGDMVAFIAAERHVEEPVPVAPPEPEPVPEPEPAPAPEPVPEPSEPMESDRGTEPFPEPEPAEEPVDEDSPTDPDEPDVTDDAPAEGEVGETPPPETV